MVDHALNVLAPWNKPHFSSLLRFTMGDVLFRAWQTDRELAKQSHGRSQKPPNHKTTSVNFNLSQGGTRFATWSCSFGAFDKRTWNGSRLQPLRVFSRTTAQSGHTLFSDCFQAICLPGLKSLGPLLCSTILFLLAFRAACQVTATHIKMAHVTPAFIGALVCLTILFLLAFRGACQVTATHIELVHVTPENWDWYIADWLFVPQRKNCIKYIYIYILFKKHNHSEKKEKAVAKFTEGKAHSQRVHRPHRWKAWWPNDDQSTSERSSYMAAAMTCHWPWLMAITCQRLNDDDKISKIRAWLVDISMGRNWNEPRVKINVSGLVQIILRNWLDIGSKQWKAGVRHFKMLLDTYLFLSLSLDPEMIDGSPPVRQRVTITPEISLLKPNQPFKLTL